MEVTSKRGLNPRLATDLNDSESARDVHTLVILLITDFGCEMRGKDRCVRRWLSTGDSVIC